jgi:hypothetical protein
MQYVIKQLVGYFNTDFKDRLTDLFWPLCVCVITSQKLISFTSMHSSSTYTYVVHQKIHTGKI